MRLRSSLTVLFAVLLICAPALLAQTVNPNNPGIFQYFAAPVSSRLAFLASAQGGQYLLHSPAPNAKALLTRFHPELVSLYPQKPLLKAPSGTVTALTLVNCGTASGTQMNLEPPANAVPQNEPSVDFLLHRLGTTGTGNLDLVMGTATDSRGVTFGSWGQSSTGIYVHRDPTIPCYGGPTSVPAGKDFELGNPPIANPFNPADMVQGGGIAHVIADKVGDQFFVADIRVDQQVAAIGLRRIASANLLNTTLCPAGTVAFTQAPACAGANAVMVSATDDENVDFPALAQDRRATGTGAGNVYVANAALDAIGSVSEIHLTACPRLFGPLAPCSPTITISGADTAAQFASVSVVPSGPNAGIVTVVYANFGFPETMRWVKCTPKGAPLAPSCSAPTTIASEPNSLGFGIFSGGLMGNSGLRVLTIPTHVDRGDSTTGQTTFVTWAHCKVSTSFGCPDSDVVMDISTNLGASWAGVTLLDGSPGTHEFDPAITVDDGQNITKVAYYHTPDVLHFKNRTVVDLKQIPSGSTTPGAVFPITSTPDSPEGDANFSVFGAAGLGDYLGIAAHGTGAVGGSCAYVGHTNNTRLGTYSGLQNAESNNHVSKVCY